MGSACSKGKGAKKDKIGKKGEKGKDWPLEKENNDKLNVKEIKIESQEETKNQDVVDTERLDSPIRERIESQEENKHQDVVDIERLGYPIREKNRPIDVNDKARIYQAVTEAVANTKGLVTLPQIEAYISNKYRNFPINSYRRRSIFTKVIADEFYKGQLAVKTNKHCS